MNRTNQIAAAGLIALMAACASKPGVQTAKIPERGVAISSEMLERCQTEITNLVAELSQNSSAISTKVNIPSAEYLSCFNKGLSGQIGERQYKLVPTDNPRIYDLIVYQK